MNILPPGMSIFLNFLSSFGKMKRSLKNTFWSGMVLAVLCLGSVQLDAATFTASLDRDTFRSEFLEQFWENETFFKEHILVRHGFGRVVPWQCATCRRHVHGVTRP